MSDYPMLISNKLHSFRNFTYTNLRVYFQITTLYLLTFSFLFRIFGEIKNRKVIMKYISIIT